MVFVEVIVGAHSVRPVARKEGALCAPLRPHHLQPKPAWLCFYDTFKSSGAAKDLPSSEKQNHARHTPFCPSVTAGVAPTW